MDTWFQIFVTILCSVIASSGFWAILQHMGDRNSAEKEMLVGLAHDRIVYIGMQYVERGYITRDEYENLHDYLYVPYAKLGGNGSAKRVMDEVDKLPIHASSYTRKGDLNETQK